jgi:branched-chain amino acid transport system substrate-binding protein
MVTNFGRIASMKNKRWFLFLLFLFFLNFPISSPRAEMDQNNDFTIAFLADISGPLGFWNAPRLVGIQDAAEYLNNNLGGIGGKKIKINWRDHKSNVALALKYYQELRSHGSLIWHTCGTGEQQMLKPYYEQDKTQVIFTCAVSPGVVYPVGYVFGTAAYYPNQFGAFIDWLVETWEKQNNTRRPRVAFMTYESAYGRACVSQETLAYAKKKGVEIVETIYVPFVTTDPVSPLQKAKKAGADWLYGQWLWQTVPPYLKANKDYALGLNFCVNSFGVDEVMISKGGEAAEGLTGVTSWYLPSENTPGINLARVVLEEKQRRPEDRGAPYFVGWMNMLATKRVIEESLARLGNWEKINPQEIIATLEGWQEVDIDGLCRLNYGPQRRGAGKIRIVQVQGGKWVPVTPWRQTPRLVPGEWRRSFDE